MLSFYDLRDFFAAQDFKLVMAAEAQTRIHREKNGKIVSTLPIGGVSVGLDPVAKASKAIYIARGKTPQDRQVADSKGKYLVKDPDGDYTLKRLFFPEDEAEKYYDGFSIQTLWPLCHVAFERPEFNDDWYEGYKKVNQRFAQAIKEEIKGKTFIWINDFQLSLVPKYLDKSKDTVVAMFWHIPWPTWEAFRVLPYKKEILESLLNCDFLAFHRGYQAKNFIDTARRELELRVDEERGRLHYNDHITTVGSLPMGIDTDVVRSFVEKEDSEENLLSMIIKNILGVSKKRSKLDKFFDKNKVILGIDRLDYTKGLRVRLFALDKFFEKNPGSRGQVTYVGIIAPSREKVKSYKDLKKDLYSIAKRINEKYGNKNWQPINLIYKVFTRTEAINLYRKANLCLVTPLDDGMNLVSKEFVIASESANNPGMLVLSQFAGSAIDLTSALIVNPYDIDEVAAVIKRGLEMNKEEKVQRLKNMANTLEEKNVYQWAQDFVKASIASK
ncbi:MAG: trehalose-6-phosphate synthase [Candidatus Levybacteria bacterium]|nr:trehalose-6-phosphate synthase [Candidatus Levybacteria bacterium]